MSKAEPTITELAEDLRNALTYLIDVHYGEVCRDANDVQHFQKAAYTYAITAVRRAEPMLRPIRPLGRIDLAHIEMLALEHRLPVKVQLREIFTETRTRVATALGVFDRWETLEYDRRIKNTAAFLAIAKRLVETAIHIANPLPVTTACICRSCGLVLLPKAGGAYEHCQMSWQSHRSLNQKALPDGFWNTYRPGDKYARYTQLEPVLDGHDRPNILGGVA
jgi:hypothetical protein